ncbi:MAG: leucine-rich repeat protein [Paludibacteraceae bacterium]|nr:leucine-rich repeat protein [Paludibacteraceae bacterium]MBQ7439104.1 leucine-rich repeat protein [Paludibacteraceae bacterium]
MATLSETFTAIADAIRTKAGTTEKLTPAQMPTAIENIPSGGGSEDILKILQRGDTSAEFFDFDFTAHGLDYVPNFAFAYGNRVSKVTLPTFLRSGNRTDIGNSAFNNCTNMTLDSDEITCGRIYNSAFSYCSNIVVRRLDCTQIDQGAFSTCRNIKYLAIVCSGEMYNSIVSCVNLKKVWINKESTLSATNPSMGIFAGCSKLTDIYTDATEKPSTWGPYFNYINSATQATVHYGVSEAEFDAIVEAEEAAS